MSTPTAWAELNAPERAGGSYGTEDTYEIAAWWLKPTGAVEDWGCGRRRFAAYAREIGCSYRGIDSSGSPDVLADLAAYRSTTPGLLLRHVLEHNPETWPEIVRGAVESCTDRMVIVLYVPAGIETTVHEDIPVSGVNRDALDRMLDGPRQHFEVRTASMFQWETVYLIGEGPLQDPENPPRIRCN